MEKPSRTHTFYTKDSIHAEALKDVLQPSVNLDEVIRDQALTVRNCQDAVKKVRHKLLLYLDEIVTSNRVNALAILEKEFLENVLESIKKEESEIRCRILGQQASVEMFKQAVQSKEVEDVYLQAEREKRDASTRYLASIVKDREIMFSVLENFQLLSSNHNGVDDGILVNLKGEYEDVASNLQSEQEKLKKFTEWQKQAKTRMK